MASEAGPPHPLPGWKRAGGFRLLGTAEVWPSASNLADPFRLIGIVRLLMHLRLRDGAAEGLAGAARTHEPAP